VRGGVSPSSPGGGSGARPPPRKYLNSKMEHFSAVFKLECKCTDVLFKLDLTEEARTQLQEEKAIASSFLILATPMVSYHTVKRPEYYRCAITNTALKRVCVLITASNAVIIFKCFVRTVKYNNLFSERKLNEND